MEVNNEAIGTGYSNTIALVSAMKNAAYEEEKSDSTTTEYAAKLCYNYSCSALTSAADNDWFLPSIKELKLMHANLKLNGLGNFQNLSYWSSTERSYLTVYFQNFSISNTNQDNASTKTSCWNIRPVRAFTVCKDTVNHTWQVTSSSEVNCSTGGTITYKCSVCNATKEVKIPAVDHVLKAVEAKGATCTEIGWKAYTECTKCGFKDGYTEIPATGHNNSGVYDHDGTSHWYKCSVCGGKYPTPEEHKFSGWATVTEANCTTVGKQTRECQFCHYVEEQEIPATGHKYEYTSESCDKTGHYQVCSVCGDTTEKEAHTLELEEVISEPTCTKTGNKRMGCTKCTRSYLIELPKTDHVFEEAWTSNETWHWHECINAMCSEKDSMAAHVWNDGEVTTEATCAQDGVKTYTCTICGNQSKTEKISGENNHSFSSTWSSDSWHHWHDATCTHTTKTSDYAEHTWDSGKVTKVATCVEDGEKTFTCTVCGQTKTAAIQKDYSAHTYENYKCKYCGSWSTGPTGGYVFYDCDADNNEKYTDENGATKTNPDGLTSSDCGWRFLEAAPSDLSSTYPFGYYRASDSVANEVVGTETGIGTGKSNTETLVSKMGSSAYIASTGSDKGDYAAKKCADYSITVNNVLYEDWFLPSKDELNLMISNLAKKQLGSFGSNYYCSSSEQSESNVWINLKGNNVQTNGRWKYCSYNVRPIRAFN